MSTPRDWVRDELGKQLDHTAEGLLGQYIAAPRVTSSFLA